MSMRERLRRLTDLVRPGHAAVSASSVDLGAPTDAARELVRQAHIAYAALGQYPTAPERFRIERAMTQAFESGLLHAEFYGPSDAAFSAPDQVCYPAPSLTRGMTPELTDALHYAIRLGLRVGAKGDPQLVTLPPFMMRRSARR